MNNNQENQRNKIYLSGKIITEPVFSHTIYGEGFYEMYMEVPRLSEQKDVLPVTISERLIQDKSVIVGSEISVIGQFRSYNKIIDGKSKLMLTVFVRDIVDIDKTLNPNSIELRGYICKAPIYRTTPFKREICDLLIAVNRAYNKSDYIPCIAWGRNARFVQGLSIGSKVAISGRVQSRIYQKNIGGEEYETRTAYEISINKITTDDYIDSVMVENDEDSENIEQIRFDLN